MEYLVNSESSLMKYLILTSLLLLQFSNLLWAQGAGEPNRTGASPYSRSPEIISVIDDLEVRAFVTKEGRRILEVTQNSDLIQEYQFFLAVFNSSHFAGLSSGNHIIHVNIDVARKAYFNRNRYAHLLSLRRILAHEIAHDILNHAKAGHRSVKKELDADRLGIILWKRLGWDCSFWVLGYESKQESGITSSLYPPELQLRQAKALCPEAEERKIEQSSYLGVIKKRVKSVWQYPQGISGVHEVNLIFVLDRGGQLVRVRAVESTNSELESNLILAMKQAAPFPPIPDGLRYLEGEEIHFRFNFNIRVAK
ncbi:MAG: TonB family protein [Nitrososphaerales archaeon]